MKVNDLGKLEDYAQDENLRVTGGGVDRHWGKVNMSGFVRDNFGEAAAKDFATKSWLVDEAPFVKRFNLKYIEFGNWMNQPDRYKFMIGCAITFDNLASILGVSKADIGLAQRVAIALGARGRGGRAAAHYEVSPYAIINLTKPHGERSLVHEYGHALDNLIAVMSANRRGYFPSGGHTTRKTPLSRVEYDQLSYGEKLFENFFNALYATPFVERLKKTNSDYLESRVEVWARTFEAWTRLQFNKKSIHNDWGVKTTTHYNKNAQYPKDSELKAVDKQIRAIIRYAFHLADGQLKADLNGLGAASVLEQNRGLVFSGMKPKYTILQSYDHLIDRALGKVASKDGELKDTISAIMQFSNTGRDQVKALAAHLKTGDHAQDAFNVWHWLKTNFKYGYDQGGEEIRTPAASWANRKIRVDCEDFAIFAAALMRNMGYPATLEIVGFSPDQGMAGKWHHIYMTSGPYVIDPVMDTYGIRPPAIIRTMKIDLISGVNTSTDDVIYGLGSIVPSAKDEITRKLEIQMRPLAERWKRGDRSEQLRHELRKLQYVISLNGTTERDELLPLMQYIEDVHPDKGIVFYPALPDSALKAINDYAKELRAINELAGLGKINLRKGITNAVKKVSSTVNNIKLPNGQKIKDTKIADVVNKVADKARESDALKKAVNVALKFNPAFVVSRQAFLTLLKFRIFGMARRFWYGYQNENTAKAQKWNIAAWRNAVAKTKEAEEIFVKLGGTAENFKEAVMKGGARAIKRGKIDLKGLGFEPVTTTAAAAGPTLAEGAAAVITAASPVLLAVVAKRNNIDPKEITNGAEDDTLAQDADGNWTYNGKPLTVDGDNLVDSNGEVVSTVAQAEAEALVNKSNDKTDKVGFLTKIKNIFGKLLGKKGSGSGAGASDSELPGLNDDSDGDEQAGGGWIGIALFAAIAGGTLYYANKKPTKRQ